MENKAHALAAGAFVLVVGAMLVALAIWLTRDSGVSRVYELSTREAVSGLQPQAAVRYRGIDIGKVAQIGFDPQTTGNVLVRIAVDDKAPITKSTFATLGYQGVTGLAFVQLDDEGESKEPLVGDAGNPPRIPMRAGLLSKLTDQGTAIIAQAQETIARVTQLLSPEHQEALVATVTNLGAAAHGINEAAGGVNKVAADASKTLHAIETTAAEMAKTAAAATVTAAEFGKAARRISDKGGVLDKIGDATEALVSTANTLNATTLPRVHRVSDDASSAVRQATRVFNAFNDNPQSLIYGGGPIAPGPGEPGFVAPGRTN
jgi:phospholipid/cholesterol/gamma-HCH transport system substrate-binding protein